MLWLQNPQWGRWSIAVVLTILAIWAEFGPDPSVEHPFATRDIAAGEPIGPDNTEARPVPGGLLSPVPLTGFATRPFHPDEPITPGGVSDVPKSAPEGWWSIEIALPKGAIEGDAVELILLDSGVTVSGVVTSAPVLDPLSANSGTVAIAPDSALAVASSVANGRVAVLVRNS